MTTSDRSERGDRTFDVPSFMRDYIKFWLYYGEEDSGGVREIKADPYYAWSEMNPDTSEHTCYARLNQGETDEARIDYYKAAYEPQATGQDPVVTWPELSFANWSVNIGSGASLIRLSYWEANSGLGINNQQSNFTLRGRGVQDVAAVIINGVRYDRWVRESPGDYRGEMYPDLEAFFIANRMIRTNIEFNDGTYALPRPIPINVTSRLSVATFPSGKTPSDVVIDGTEYQVSQDPPETWTESTHEFQVVLNSGTPNEVTIRYGKDGANPSQQIFINFHEHPSGKDPAKVFLNGVEYTKTRGGSFFFSATTPAIETLLSDNPTQPTNVQYDDDSFAVSRSGDYVSARLTALEDAILGGQIPTNLKYTDDSYAIDRVTPPDVSGIFTARNRLKEAAKEFLSATRFRDRNKLSRLVSLDLINDTFDENYKPFAQMTADEPTTLFMFEGSLSRNIVGPGHYEQRVYEMNCILATAKSRSAMLAYWDFLNVLFFRYNRLLAPFRGDDRTLLSDRHESSLLPPFAHQVLVTQLSEARKRNYWTGQFNIVIRSFGSLTEY